MFCLPGADVNGQAGDGASPLFEACKNGHLPVVNALLSLRADANRSMKSGLLPLHVAVQNNHSRSETHRFDCMSVFYLRQLFCTFLITTGSLTKKSEVTDVNLSEVKTCWVVWCSAVDIQGFDQLPFGFPELCRC